ncbi:hypothetical protein RUM43_010291 [Polyplax serrata]|uniref:Uncharacterized protein n=1 Tax=Polyplax serrata TaxID=468196 RepID=A0AAN8P779_POLSC
MNRHLTFSFGFSIRRQREIRYTARYPRDRAKVRLSGVVNVNLAASVKLVNHYFVSGRFVGGFRSFKFMISKIERKR